MRDAAARRALQEELAHYACGVHQSEDPPLFTREPQPVMRSHHWRWRDLEPLLRKLGAGVELGTQGLRRTMRLATPGLTAGTTPTFWASIQVILPGEIASAHRHTANAFRFVMRGGGATTTVDGERYGMEEGDLVLTPAWTWHDHEYHGTEPMVWLDVLDIPLMRTLEATFFEPYPRASQPVAAVPDASWRRFGSGLMRPAGPSGSSRNPLLAYPGAMAMQALAAARGSVHDPAEGVRLEYRSPIDGRDAMPTMGLSLQSLEPGFRGHAKRSTGSKLYHVVRGHGVTTIEGHPYTWEAGDFLAIAPWTWHQHANPSHETEAVLFQVNDQPVLRALGFFREETRKP